MHQLLYGLQLVGLDCLDELHSVLRRRNNEQAQRVAKSTPLSHIFLRKLCHCARSRDQTFVATGGGGRSCPRLALGSQVALALTRCRTSSARWLAGLRLRDEGVEEVRRWSPGEGFHGCATEYFFDIGYRLPGRRICHFCLCRPATPYHSRRPRRSARLDQTSGSFAPGSVVGESLLGPSLKPGFG